MPNIQRHINAITKKLKKADFEDACILEVIELEKIRLSNDAENEFYAYFDLVCQENVRETISLHARANPVHFPNETYEEMRSHFWTKHVLSVFEYENSGESTSMALAKILSVRFGHNTTKERQSFARWSYTSIDAMCRRRILDGTLG